jgi:hypothetical protein
LVRGIVQLFETIFEEVSNFLLNSSDYFSGMNVTVDHQPETAFVRTTEEQNYAGPLAFLLLASLLVLIVTMAILIATLYIPGHSGLGDLLQAIGDLLPTDLVSYTT